MTENTDLSRNNSWNENTMTKNIYISTGERNTKSAM